MRNSALSFCSAIRTNDVARLSLQSSRLAHSLIWAMKSVKSAMHNLQHADSPHQTAAFRQPPDKQQDQDRDDSADHDLDDVPIGSGGDSGEPLSESGAQQRKDHQDHDDRDREPEDQIHTEAAHFRFSLSWR